MEQLNLFVFPSLFFGAEAPGCRAAVWSLVISPDRLLLRLPSTYQLPFPLPWLCQMIHPVVVLSTSLNSTQPSTWSFVVNLAVAALGPFGVFLPLLPLAQERLFLGQRGKEGWCLLPIAFHTLLSSLQASSSLKGLNMYFVLFCLGKKAKRTCWLFLFWALMQGSHGVTRLNWRKETNKYREKERLISENTICSQC